jgi:hypothetical protein
MSLSTAEIDELRALARGPIPAGWLGIQYLAALYMRFATREALAVTQLVDQATRGRFAMGFGDTVDAEVNRRVTSNFAGFILNTNTAGFRTELADPDPDNPQTGHFFSYVVWALDTIDDTEFRLALGHEFVPDTGGVTQYTRQWEAGLTGAADLRRIVVSLPLDASAEMDYSALDTEFDALGWTGRIDSSFHDETYWDPDTHEFWTDSVHTGNSVQDLRCTIAGFQFGRLIREHQLADGASACRWLERNVMSCTSRYLPTPPAAP